MMLKSTTIIALTLLLATACAHQAPRPLGLDRDLLNQRQGEFFAAMASRDAGRMAAVFSEAAVLHVANMPPVEGRGAIERFYGNMFGFLTASTASPEILELAQSGDMAYATGSVRNEFRGPQGTSEHEGKYSLVWRNLDGEWFIVLYAVSSNQAAAPR
jgi:ketosteroid isomerase-like protein